MSETEPGVRTEVEICNMKGLHARASAKFVKLAAAFDAQIYVIKDETRVDAQSIMGLLMLGAGKGTTIGIEAEGKQADEAVAALAELVSNRFDEDE
ncbi:MAG: HPr family phosphocarrier protein [Asticcacaulis sp.]|uniref:HPr family phosphocarrier protein n=1 Tax=Asticcacaulis sp. TaxID=1872648 RepID=UPI0039E5EC44